MYRHGWLAGHVAELAEALGALRDEAARLEAWGGQLAGLLDDGGQLLTAGNGGSAAQAQHLTAELVGRFVDERRPLSALCLSAETSSLTALVNDYGPDEMFARQVRAHGRPGDVLLLLSTSGGSSNVVHAARAGRGQRLRVWAMTGPLPNPLAAVADDTLAVPAASTAAVQEAHLVAAHALCAAVDAALPAPRPAAVATADRPWRTGPRRV